MNFYGCRSYLVADIENAVISNSKTNAENQF